MRRCVWSRNLKNEEAMARVGPQRHRKKNDDFFFVLIIRNKFHRIAAGSALTCVGRAA